MKIKFKSIVSNLDNTQTRVDLLIQASIYTIEDSLSYHIILTI